MDDIGPQLVEQPGVVGDGEDAEPVVVGHRLDPTGDVAQRVDVETAVDLVENRELGSQHRELEGLGPLLLPTGELDVQPAVEELLRDTEARRFRRHARREVVGRAALTPERGVEEVAEADPGELHRVLEREEETVGGSFVRREPEQFLTVDRDGTAGDGVVVSAHQHVGECRLPRAVRPHERVHLTGTHLEVDPAQDLLPGNRRVQVGDLQHTHAVTPFTTRGCVSRPRISRSGDATWRVGALIRCSRSRRRLRRGRRRPVPVASRAGSAVHR